MAGDFMANMDYPIEALRASQQGLSVVQVQVSAKGKVKSCSVQQSSGSAALDQATCKLARTQRFAPARNAAGERVEGVAPMRINWRLPGR